MIKDELKLPTYLRRAIDGQPDAETITYEAKRLMAAISACSFYMKEFDYFDLNLFSSTSVQAARISQIDNLTPSETLDGDVCFRDMITKHGISSSNSVEHAKP